MKKKFLLIAVVSPLIAFILAGIRIYYNAVIWEYKGPDLVFKITPGETFSKINYRLYKKKITSSSKLFYRYAQFNNLMTKFKTGHFQIKTNSNMVQIFDSLIYGHAITKKVTIPEGKNLFEIGKLLEKNNVTSYSEFVRMAKNPNFTRKLGIPADRVEGYLYPNTYKFTPKSNAKDVIKIMVAEFNKKIKTVNLASSSMKLHSIITLASIVEKETGAHYERPTIAGVFHNRLKKRMRLQSDPTTIYGIYEQFNGNLRKKHLQEKTPYNTYRINGLPKGPISNPGLESIRAVLNPAKHQALFFVSQNDGTHIFSKTYREHIKAVNKFQKTRKNRKGKSWRNLKQ